MKVRSTPSGIAPTISTCCGTSRMAVWPTMLRSPATLIVAWIGMPLRMTSRSWSACWTCNAVIHPITTMTASAESHQKRTWMSPQARRRASGVSSRGRSGTGEVAGAAACD